MRTRELISSTNIIPPIACIVILVLGNSFLTTAITSFLTKKDVAPYLIGIVQAANYLGIFIGAWNVRFLTQRFGHTKTLSILAGFLTVSILILTEIDPPIGWVPLRLLGGLCVGGFYVTIESWLLLESPLQVKGQVFSLYSIFLYLSHAVSQLILMLIPLDSVSPFLFCSMFVSLSALPANISTKISPHVESNQGIDFLKYTRSAKLAVFGCLVSGLVLGGIYSFTASFALVKGLSPEALTFVTIIGGALAQWPVGYFLDRRKTIMVGICLCLLSIIPLLVLLTEPQNLYIIYGSFFALGAFTLTLYPVFLKKVTDGCQQNELVQASSVVMFIYSLGTVIGPLLAGAMITMRLEYLFSYLIACTGSWALAAGSFLVFDTFKKYFSGSHK